MKGAFCFDRHLVAAIVIAVWSGVFIAVSGEVRAAGTQNPPEAGLSAETASGRVDADGDSVWKGADYSSLSAFIAALESERYTDLILRRISADLARGRVAGLRIVLERYYLGRSKTGSDSPGYAAALSQSVTDDVHAAIRHTEKSSVLSIPGYMAEPVIAFAQRIALAAHGLENAVPDEDIVVEVPEVSREEKRPKPKARAENTGLFRDAADMVAQPHLRFLVGGDQVTARARVLAEILRIAQNDNLIVDDKSVQTFVDRLVEAGKVHPDESQYLVFKTSQALGLGEPAPGDVTEIDDVPAEREPVVPDSATGKPGPESSLPDDAAERGAREEDTDQAQGVPNEETGQTGVADDAVVDRKPGSATAARTLRRRVQRTPRVPETALRPSNEPRSSRENLVYMLEVGAGVTVPGHHGGLDQVDPSMDLEPGLAARIGLGAMWLEAAGGAHVALSLVGIVGESKADDFAGPPALASDGNHTYFGVMPFLTIEIPVADMVNLRAGAGVGMARQHLEVFGGGTKIADAEGNSLLVQFGGGARLELAPCVDAGLDIFATHLDAVKGSGIGGTAFTFGGGWDIAVYASMRVAFGRADEAARCRAFGP